jgi:hypothetical protein
MTFEQMLHEWHEFFFMVGTSGATLMALLFVAVSLGTGFLTDERAAGTRTFFSPVVIHFTGVFFVSAVCLVPGHKVTYFAYSIAACALIGLAVSGFATVQMLRYSWSQLLEDRLAYGLLPAAGYAALLAAAWMIAAEKPLALDVLAGSLMLLLIVNIRNAWDLTLEMVRQQSRRKKQKR